MPRDNEPRTCSCESPPPQAPKLHHGA
jgi:hypothetical protein